MLFHRNRKLTECHLIILYLLLTQCCRGKSQLINSPQTIIATLGHDIILPCNLVPGEDASDLTLEWTRPDLNPRFVHVCRSGEELVDITHELFKKRTSLFTDELKLGNISLKLSKVKIHDQGTYRCFIPKKDRQSFVQLVVGSDAVTSPVITSADTDKANRLVLQCESKGWYPEPEVSWLDSEGNLLSAGPTETVRGPDDLYTVSRRLTVEKSDNFTCRVQQKNINQTRETHFYVPDDFFELQSSSSAVTVGLAVSLAVCITFIFSVIFLFWKWRQKIIKIKTSRRDEAEEAQLLRTRENVEVNKHVSWNPYKWFKDEQQKVKKLTEEKQRLNNELQTDRTELTEEKQKHEKELEDKRTEFENKLSKVQQELQKEKEGRTKAEEELEAKIKEVEKLTEEKQTNENKLQNELQTLKEKVDSKNKEVEKLTEEKQKHEKELEDLRTEVEKLTKKNKEFEKNLSEVQQDLQKEKAKTKELETKQTELQQLCGEKERNENELKKVVDSKNKEVEKLTEEKQKHEKELEDKRREVKKLTEEKQTLNNELQTDRTELETQLQQLREEKERNENELQTLKEKLEKNKELQDIKTNFST